MGSLVTKMKSSTLILIALAHSGLALSWWDALFKKGDKSAVTDQGAYWNTTEYPCGGDDYGLNGTIVSPNYPYNYPNNAYCEWYVLLYADAPIRVTIEDMDLEPCCDFLDIWDWNNNSLARLTGHNDTYDDIISTGNNLQLYFTSDGSVSGGGFKLFWSEDTGSPSCGGYIYDTEGTIVSPNYPDNYPNNADCKWYITAPEGTTITLSFESFDTEDRYDRLKIWDGLEEYNDTLLISVSGNPDYVIRDVTSTGNTVLVDFESDGSNYYDHSGFKLNWFASSTPTHHPPTNPPSGELECYSCIGCDNIDDDTNIVRSDEYLAC